MRSTILHKTIRLEYVILIYQPLSYPWISMIKNEGMNNGEGSNPACYFNIKEKWEF